VPVLLLSVHLLSTRWCVCRGVALSDKKLVGTLPASLSVLTALTRFAVDNNVLSGTIPDGVTRMEAIV
jgi:hypothetical protein